MTFSPLPAEIELTELHDTISARLRELESEQIIASIRSLAAELRRRLPKAAHEHVTVIMLELDDIDSVVEGMSPSAKSLASAGIDA